MGVRLQARPLLCSHNPMYPTRLAVEDLPQLLSAHQPPSWLGRREMAGAMAALLAVGGCQQREDESSGLPPKSENSNTVAPIFSHGTGAATGLMIRKARGRSMLAGDYMPSYRSTIPEDEALAVIREELAIHGIKLTHENITWSNVKVRGYEPYKGIDWETGVPSEGRTPINESLEVDLIDMQRRIAVEYINADEDFYQFGGDDMGEEKDLKRAAQKLVAEVKDHDLGYCFGTFYDPLHLEYDLDASSMTIQEQCDQRARELLRLQVKDFVEWLKGQGVI